MNTKSQAAKLTNFMLNGYMTTRKTALTELDIENCTAVISDIRGAGIEVINGSSLAGGKKHTTYSITDEQLDFLIEKGRVVLQPCGVYTIIH